MLGHKLTVTHISAVTRTYQSHGSLLCLSCAALQVAIEEESAATIIRRLLLALAFLHNQPELRILHCDINADNVSAAPL